MLAAICRERLQRLPSPLTRPLFSGLPASPICLRPFAESGFNGSPHSRQSLSFRGLRPPNLLAAICRERPQRLPSPPARPVFSGLPVPEICLQPFAGNGLNGSPHSRQSLSFQGLRPPKFACSHLQGTASAAALTPRRSLPFRGLRPPNLLAAICRERLQRQPTLPAEPVFSGPPTSQICLQPFAGNGLSGSPHPRRSLPFRSLRPPNLLAAICRERPQRQPSHPAGPVFPGLPATQICLQPFAGNSLSGCPRPPARPVFSEHPALEICLQPFAEHRFSGSPHSRRGQSFRNVQPSKFACGHLQNPLTYLTSLVRRQISSRPRRSEIDFHTFL